jgi:hypothetical protein
MKKARPRARFVLAFFFTDTHQMEFPGRGKESYVQKKEDYSFFSFNSGPLTPSSVSTPTAFLEQQLLLP